MKKRNAFYLFSLAVAMLLTTLPLSAQLTPFQKANEVMMYEESALESFIGTTWGPDPASPLTYSSHVDPAGQNFDFSLNVGSTYLGKPITLTTSGALRPLNVWTVSTTGTYNGLPWSTHTTYVPPAAVLPTGSPYIFEGAVVYNSVGPFNPCTNCTPISNGCTTYAGPGSGDMEVCAPGTAGTPNNCSQTTQNPNPGGSGWTAALSVACGGPGFAIKPSGSSSGFTPNDGSLGNFLSLITPVSVSTTVSYFDDLGSGANTYQCCTGWPVSGSGGGTTYTAANEFTAAASGSVSRIDIGIGVVSAPDSFFAALYTASGNLPVTLIQQWNNLGTSLPSGQCCGVVTIPNITGLTLTAGESYFLVIGPTSRTSTTSLSWNYNSTGATGLDLYATSGCQNGSGNGCNWNSNGNNSTLGAFDILSQPQGSVAEANQFQVTASGSVSQIDVAVGYVSGQNAFDIEIHDSNNGVPGALLASWDEPSPQNFGGCCALISITGISGLSLTAGQPPRRLLRAR